MNLHSPLSAPPPALLLEEFLAVQEWSQLIQYSYDRSAEFVASRVVGDGGQHYVDSGYRRSSVLFDVGPFRQIFADRILAFLPRVLATLDQPAFPVMDIEMQITATGHGGLFARHNDNGAASLRSRWITFVYFFYCEPRPFQGGELWIYERDPAGQDGEAPETFRLITPTQNQICFFPSDAAHEVRPVQGWSDAFMASRFTLNGWLHR